MREYWNHNTAYHPWIQSIAATHQQGDFLDVGCGDGLLLHRLAPLARSVTGIEPHPPSLARARARLVAAPNARLAAQDFGAFDPKDERFDLVTFVASIHHMDLQTAFAKAAGVLRPGGDLVVVGLAANRTVADWVVSGLALPLVRVSSALHGETADVGVPVATPVQTLREICDAARISLPGARIRRGLYYRYLLRWTRPS